MSELSRLSTQQSLMDVSALEQELVCDDDITVSSYNNGQGRQKGGRRAGRDGRREMHEL
jgi:hypothetical protein